MAKSQSSKTPYMGGVAREQMPAKPPAKRQLTVVLGFETEGSKRVKLATASSTFAGEVRLATVVPNQQEREVKQAIEAWTTPAACRSIQMWRRGEDMLPADEAAAKLLDANLCKAVEMLEDCSGTKTLSRGVIAWPGKNLGSFLETGWLACSVGAAAGGAHLMIVPRGHQRAKGVDVSQFSVNRRYSSVLHSWCACWRRTVAISLTFV